MIDQDFLLTHSVLASARGSSEPSATYLRALLENSPIPIIVLDAHHRFTMCNLAFEKLFQYTPKQLASEDIDALIAGPEMSEHASQLTRAVLQGGKVHTMAQRRRRDGLTIDVEIYGIPLIVDGELAGVYGIYQDVTERNRAQQAFRAISDQLENLQQEERRRLARDLHDSTSQELAVLNWNLTRLAKLIDDQLSDEPQAQLKTLVHETREIASQCSARIRSAAYLLHPPLLGKGGLALAVPWMVEGFEERSGIQVHLKMSEGLGRFNDEAEIAIYRVLQEGLANVLRHSGSAEADVILRHTEAWLELEIRDRGDSPTRHLLLEAYRSRSGVGISGMRERLERLGGCLTIDCSSTETIVRASVPAGS